MSSIAVALAACFALVAPDDTAADAVTLKDGQVVRGEVDDAAPRGTVTLLVRRSWAREHLPEWADRWEAAEAPWVKRATDQRRQRLTTWRRERPSPPTGPDDRITPWIDGELERLGHADARSELLVAKLPMKDVRAVARAPKGHPRLLRLAWLSRIPAPEGMPFDELTEALEGRGLDVRSPAPVSVDALKPLTPETEWAWLVRRAATEALFDTGLRFVRYQGVVFAEPAEGQPLAPGDGLAALSALKDLLGENPTDPLTERLRGVAASGRVGAVVTRLDVSPDFAGVTVEMTLWVRQKPDRWAPAGSRSARVQTDGLGPDAGKDLADDPRVASAFRAVEALGLGTVPVEWKQRSLAVGAATRKALARVRTAANADLSALALPVLDTRKDAPRPKSGDRDAASPTPG